MTRHDFEVRFQPIGTTAGWSFPMEGKCPEGVRISGDKPTIFWGVKSLQSDRFDLTTGERLADLTGCVFVEVGDDALEGKTESANGGRLLGILHYDRAGYSISLYVSQRIFDRLQLLVESGRVPRLSVWLAEAQQSNVQAIRFSGLSDLVWDTVNQPDVEISWCKFGIALGAPMAANSEDQPFLGFSSPTKSDFQRLQGEITAVAQRINRVARLLIQMFWVIVTLLVVMALWK